MPNRAGGGYDAYARALAPVFEKQTGAVMIVTNAPAAGGFVGIAKVARSEPEDNFLGLVGTPKVFGVGDRSVPPSDLQALAAFAVDRQAWIGRKDAELADYIGTEVIGGASTTTTVLTRQILAGRAIGTKVKVVAGYNGSVETDAALLRGEIDLNTGTVQTGTIGEEQGDFRFLFILSDKPMPGLEDIPYFAGPGGLVDRLTADKPPAEREEAMRTAQLVVDLNEHIRAVFASRKLQGERRDCLAAALEDAVKSEAFSKAMATIGRPVEPMDFEQTSAFMARVGKAYSESSDLLEELRLEAEN